MKYRLGDNVSVVETLGARNVIRMREAFPYNKMTEKIDGFITEVEQAGGHINGPIVYSLNNMPNDEGIVDIEFFLPLEEDYLYLKETVFSSYFEVKNLIATAVSHDYENLTKIAYAELLWTLEANEREVNTPFYHILPTDGSTKVTVLLGYAY